MFCEVAGTMPPTTRHRASVAPCRTHDHASWCATFSVGTAPIAAV